MLVVAVEQTVVAAAETFGSAAACKFAAVARRRLLAPFLGEVEAEVEAATSRNHQIGLEETAAETAAAAEAGGSTAGTIERILRSAGDTNLKVRSVCSHRVAGHPLNDRENALADDKGHHDPGDDDPFLDYVRDSDRHTCAHFSHTYPMAKRERERNGLASRLRKVALACLTNVHSDEQMMMFG